MNVLKFATLLASLPLQKQPQRLQVLDILHLAARLESPRHTQFQRADLMAPKFRLHSVT